jgi:hypothetical protein
VGFREQADLESHPWVRATRTVESYERTVTQRVGDKLKADANLPADTAEAQARKELEASAPTEEQRFNAIRGLALLAQADRKPVDGLSLIRIGGRG